MKRIYYPTYTRLDGLLCGVALASIKLFMPAFWTQLEKRGWMTFGIGIAVLLAGFWTFHFAYPDADNIAGILAGFPLVSIGFAVLVISATANNGPLRLRAPGAKAVATLAYSLYLSHKAVAHVDPILIPWLRDNTSWPAVGVYAVTCLGFAALLYFAVERPFLWLRDRHLDHQVATRLDAEARVDPAI